MPIYEYVCKKCGHELEALQKISDKPLTECPECHAQSLEKQMSAPPFHLKGTGWYATDFKNKGKTASSTTGKDSGSSDKSGSND